jgi:hypothetical protein
MKGSSVVARELQNKTIQWTGTPRALGCRALEKASQSTELHLARSATSRNATNNTLNGGSDSV